MNYSKPKVLSNKYYVINNNKLWIADSCKRNIDILFICLAY